MSLSRRNLLKLIASGVVGHTLDIDRLLWVPGEKTIFIPSLKDTFLPFRPTDAQIKFYTQAGQWMFYCVEGADWGFPSAIRTNNKTSKVSE